MTETQLSKKPAAQWSRWWCVGALSLIMIGGAVSSFVPIYREQQVIADFEERGFEVWTRSRLPQTVREKLPQDWVTATHLSNSEFRGYFCSLSSELRGTPWRVDFDINADSLKESPQPHRLILGPRISNVTAQDVINISQLRSLQSLRLTHVDLSPAQMEMLSEISELRQFSIVSRQPMEIKHLRPLNRLQKLEGFFISSLVIDREVIELLAGFPQLKHLAIANPKYVDASLAELLSRLDLEELRIYHAKLNDDDIDAIVGSKGLQNLHLDFTNLNDEQLARLVSLTTLEFLSVAETRVTSEGVSDFQMKHPKPLLLIHDFLDLESE